MKIAVLGASGKSGALIVKEALSRGDEVNAFVRDSKKVQPSERLKVTQKDIFSLTSGDLEGFDVIIDAFGEWSDMTLHKKHIIHLNDILKSNSARLLVVGGAGSLYMDKEHKVTLADTPDFPDSYKEIAAAMREVLDYLRETNEINWVYISPAAMFEADGEKSGNYSINGEEFSVNKDGESIVSYADFASATLDIAKSNSYNKVRVSVIGL